MNVILGSKLNSDVISHIRSFMKPSPKQQMRKVFQQIESVYEKTYQEEFENYEVFHDLYIEEEDQVNYNEYQLKLEHFPNHTPEEEIIESFIFDILLENKHNANMRSLSKKYA